MALYGIIFGSFPALSAAEVEAVMGLPRPSEERVRVRGVTPGAVVLEAATDDIILQLFDRLGGATRAVSILAEGISFSGLPSQLQKCAKTVMEPRPIFGITVVGGNIATSQIQRWGLELKKEFRKDGRSSRFVFNKSAMLSAAQVKKNQLLEKGAEFVLLSHEGKWVVGTTIGIQDVDEWSERDMERPRRNARRGMLPPKIARIMVNLTSRSQQSDIRSQNRSAFQHPISDFRPPILLDPFCGSGTVLMEALQLGCSVIGSDVSAEAVEDTKANLEWLQRISNIQYSIFNIFPCDVRHLSQKLPTPSIDAIVTEPDLGPPQGKLLDSTKEMERTCVQLSNLYLDAFEEFNKLLKPGGRVVISLPVWRVRTRNQLVYSIPDVGNIPGFRVVTPISSNLSPITYTLQPRGTLLYGRPNQFVWREIVILEKI